MNDVRPSREVRRIYADFHGTVASRRNSSLNAVMLSSFGSLRDLSNAGIRLKEGDRILIVADSDEAEDIECEAETYFDPELKVWMAEMLGEIQYVPQRPSADPEGFFCVSCRNPFPMGSWRPSTEVCPCCGTSVNAAIAPPDKFIGGA